MREFGRFHRLLVAGGALVFTVAALVGSEWASKPVSAQQTSTSTATPTPSTSTPVLFGHGAPNYIPIWTSGNTLGNSVLFQTGGNVGVGTTSPQATLDVDGSGVFGIRGVTSSTADSATGVRGDATATTGTNNGVLGVSAGPTGVGVSGNATSLEGGTGVYGQTVSPRGIGVSGASLATTGSAPGVSGSSMSPGGSGVFGVNNASAGGVGVNGTTFSSAGNGVIGNNPITTGGGGGGVIGLTSSADFGFSYAIRGTATASTGSALAVFGETFSPNGTAGYFLNRGGGNIIVGHTGINDTLSVFRVDSTGRVFADGGFQPSGADFAESLPITGSRNNYAPGDLLVIDPTAKRHVALAQHPYSTLVAGIYSTKPGLLGSTRKVDESTPKNEVPLAVVGIVPCKVTTENGPIAPGDLLVASSMPGHAMKGTDRARMLGAVVGKALEPLREGTGLIQVLVTLQ